MSEPRTCLTCGQTIWVGLYCDECSTMKALKPCWNCETGYSESKEISLNYEMKPELGKVRVWCPCGVSGPWRSDVDEAGEAWNYMPRADNAIRRETIEECLEEGRDTMRVARTPNERSLLSGYMNRIRAIADRGGG